MKIINVRGPNGSGKTTLLKMLGKNYTHLYPGIRDARNKPIPITLCKNPWEKVTGEERGSIALIGDYTPMATGTTAGCDRIPTQQDIKNVINSINHAVEYVIFEGVIVSTIYGPWKEFADPHGGMTWAFLNTPLDLCLGRIQARNGGKVINEKLVVDKFHTINRVKEKASAAGLDVATIRYDYAWADFKHLLYKAQ